MLGDYADFIQSERQLIEDVIKTGAAATGSVVPALMVRGNHDDRGPGAVRPETFGLDRLYYKTVRGNYTFIVTDSGEDLDDGAFRLGDFYAFRQYMREQQRWLDSISEELKNSGNTNIVLTHAAMSVNQAGNPTGFFPNHDIRVAHHFWLNNSGIDIVAAGHNHTVHHREPDFVHFHYHRFLTGGNTSNRQGEGLFSNVFNGFSNGFMASQMTFSNPRELTFKGVNDKGEVLFSPKDIPLTRLA
jgi:hypothetical protein